MEEHEARAAIAATLYEGETLKALGPAKDIKEPALKLAEPHNPWVWLGFTEFRFIEIPFANGNVLSQPLPAVHRLELRRGMLGGRKLYVNVSGAPDEFGLSIFHVPNDFAAAIKPLLDARRQAPPLPAESTTYRRVVVPVSDPGLAALVGAESIEFNCSRCGGACGVDISNGAMSSASSGPDVFERCSGCLRTVEGPAH